MYTDDGFSARPGKDFNMSVHMGEEASSGCALHHVCFHSSSSLGARFCKCRTIILKLLLCPSFYYSNISKNTGPSAQLA